MKFFLYLYFSANFCYSRFQIEFRKNGCFSLPNLVRLSLSTQYLRVLQHRNGEHLNTILNSLASYQSIYFCKKLCLLLWSFILLSLLWCGNDFQPFFKRPLHWFSTLYLYFDKMLSIFDMVQFYSFLMFNPCRYMYLYYLGTGIYFLSFGTRFVCLALKG